MGMMYGLDSKRECSIFFNVLCSALVSVESEVKEGKGDLVGEGQG